MFYFLQTQDWQDQFCKWQNRQQTAHDEQKTYFNDILPINISVILVTKSSAAVDKLAGAIKPQINITGKMMGKMHS